MIHRLTSAMMVLLAAAATLVVAERLVAQATVEVETPGAVTVTTTEPVPATESPKKPTIDDGAPKPILEIDPENPYVARQPDEKKPEPILVREGKRLFDRSGTVVRQGTESLFVFDSGEAPMVLAACKPLERTENLSEYGKRPLKFFVSGEVTEYRGRNYLVMTDNPRAAEEDAGTAPATPAGDGSKKGDEPAKSPDANTAPPRDRNEPPPAADTDVPAPQPPPVPPSLAPLSYRADEMAGRVAGATTLLPEDKRLIDREGRLVREGALDVFVFDNGDTPIVLIPNKKLQRMEELSDFGKQPLRFRISGRVTEYRGRNYLLMSKMVVIPKAVEKL